MHEQQFISQSCSWYHVNPDYMELAQLQQLSGLKPNYLGNFQQCISSPTHNYYLFKYAINSQQNNVFFSGVCYNSSCNSTDLMYMYNAFNQYIALPAEIISIEEIDTQQVKFNYLQITFASVIISYLLIVLTFTLINIMNKQKGIKNRLLNICNFFCLQASLKVFQQHTTNNDRNKIIVGLRAISFLLMILYNTGLVLLRSQSLNVEDSEFLQGQYILIAMAYYGFDIWFFVSGFTIAVELSKNWQKHHSFKFAIMLLIRGLLQIWIVSVLTVIQIKIMLPLFGEGPLWHVVQDYLSQTCGFSIIYFFLSSNLFPRECNYFLWVWDVTLQLSLIAIILFFIINSSLRLRKVIYMIFHVLLVMGALTVAIYKYDGLNIKTGFVQGEMYSLPILRGISYFGGFNLGLFYFYFRASRQKSSFILIKIYRNQVFRLLSPALGILIMSGVAYYFRIWSLTMQKIEQSIVHYSISFLLNISLLLIILPSLLGFQGPIYSILKDQLLNYISKLSFSAYSMSYFTIIFLVYNRTDCINSNIYKIIAFSSSVMIVVLIFGFLFFISFQIVLYRIIQKYLGGQNRKFIQFY